MIYELNFDISFVSIYFRAGQRPTRARVEFRIKPTKPKSAHMQCERAAAFGATRIRQFLEYAASIASR